MADEPKWAMTQARQKRRRWLALALLLSWMIPAVACNLPTQARLRERQSGVSPQELATRLATWAPGGLATPSFGVTLEPGAVQPTPLPGTNVPAALDPSAQFFHYVTQPGDTKLAVMKRFSITAEQMVPADLPDNGLLAPDQELTITNTLQNVRYPVPILPDSEIIRSPSSVGFDVAAYVQQAGGFLASYTETVDNETLTGAQIVERSSVENSINPRLLLALIEYRSHWVLGQPAAGSNLDYPIGFYVGEMRGLSKELSLAVRQLNIAYYGWRTGSVTQLDFTNSGSARISPGLNAGSVAIQYLFSKLLYEGPWQAALYGEQSFPNFYALMFGDPWARAASIGPIFPANLQLPDLQLPFVPGERWSFTGGPHIAWGLGTPLAAIDFAPITGEPRCVVSRAWVLASAGGVIARADRNVVALDLDGDGNEETGWVLLYLHIAKLEQIAAGTKVNVNDHIGHPSCEGGNATGTHVHLVRKYNGEWIAADGPLPFEMGGWRVVMGDRAYYGDLINGDQRVTAHPDGSSGSVIVR